MELLQIVISIISIWIWGYTGKWASYWGSKKGYDPVWAGINGVRFGLLATIVYKWFAPDKTK